MKCLSWAVLLAGGDGTRLLPLTRRMCGDDRPKQFCPLFRNRSLLALTRERLAPAIPPERTTFTVVQSHRRYYEPELAGVNPARIIVQPANRGTSAAITYSVLRIIREDPDAIIAFFPTDHYYADEAAFIAAVESGCEMVREHPRFLVLMGATPESADADYGWIEPGFCLGHDQKVSSLFRVKRFWEKPSPALAAQLHQRGCLLNTFVMIAHAHAFLELLHVTIPDVLRVFAPLAERSFAEAKIAQGVYERLPAGDFSHQVLAVRSTKLLVLRLAGTGWSDLGTEDRVAAVIARQPMAKAAGHSGAYSEPRSLEAFHAWLPAYRKRLDDICEATAPSASAVVPKA